MVNCVLGYISYQVAEHPVLKPKNTNRSVNTRNIYNILEVDLKTRSKVVNTNV